MILCNVFRRDGFRLVELATVPRGDAQLLARAQQALGQLAVIGGVVTIDEGVVSSLEDEAGDVHCCCAQPSPNRWRLGPELAVVEVSIEFWWGALHGGAKFV